MRSVKGCINAACIVSQKKITYKETDDYCSKCGNKLYFVCRECYKQLPDDAKYCERCIAKKQDRKDRVKDNALKIGGAAFAVSLAVRSKGKEVINVISKVK